MATTTTTYMRCTCYQTDITTDVTRYAYGIAYQAVARVWGVEGRVSKPAGQRPLLTSVSACCAWIDDQDMLAEPLSAAAREERDCQHAREQDAWADSEAHYTGED